MAILKNHFYIVILGIMIYNFSSCHKDDNGFADLCPGCTSHAKLNGLEGYLDPDVCGFEDYSGQGDSLVYISILSVIPSATFIGGLYFGSIPFKPDSISLPDSSGNGTEVLFDVYDHAFDAPYDIYKVVPGSGSYIKVESVNHDSLSLKITFDLLLSVLLWVCIIIHTPLSCILLKAKQRW